MASLENGINVDEVWEHGNPTGTSDTFTDFLAELKREKFRLKQAFHGLKTFFFIDQPKNQATGRFRRHVLKWTALWKVLWT